MTTMTEPRVRTTFDVPERIRRALNIRAARLGQSVGDIIAEIVQDHFQDDLHLAENALSHGSEAGKSKRGRKPKLD